MPLATPNQNETREDFMTRCMSDDVMVKEYDSQEQRSAVCVVQWNKKDKAIWDQDRADMKLETHELKDVEIFEAGEWKGRAFSVDDLDEMARNASEGIIEPYITIDHSDKATDEVKASVKAAALGFMHNVRRIGEKLVADFRQVPRMVAELIQAGPLKKRSIELWRNYKHANGKIYSNVIEAVTFHGANGVPAVNTLADVVALYKDTPQRSQCDGDLEVFQYHTIEVNTMSDKNTIEITRADYDALQKSALEIEKFKSEIDALRKFKQDNEPRLAELEATAEEFEVYKDEVMKEKAQMIDDEAAAFINAQVEAGRLMPKYKDDYKADYIRYRTEDSERLTRFKAEIEERANLLPKEIEEGPSKESPAHFKNTDDMMTAINKVMARDGIAFDKARKIVLGEV